MADENETPAPPHPLRFLAKACLVLGIASLVRFGPELVFVLGSHFRASYYVLLAVDILVALLWLQCGWALRRHAFRAVGFAALAGGAILSHGAVWGCVFGSELLKERGLAESEPERFAFMGSRLLIYAIEFGFWPFALGRLLKMTGEENPTLKWSIIRAVAASTVIAAILQFILYRTIVDR